jgi:hypothetical protein
MESDFVCCGKIKFVEFVGLEGKKRGSETSTLQISGENADVQPQ